jgi:hypothetical protein
VFSDKLNYNSHQINYEVNSIRQSSRRAWRIGQDKECRVYYALFNRSQQIKQFKHVMAARGHALMCEGRLDKSSLAQYSRDSQSSLAKDLAACFADADLAQAWTDLAAKELEGVEMVSEGDFKDVLSQRMRDLADATLRLCGVDPVAWRLERESISKMLKEAKPAVVVHRVSSDEEMDIDVEILDLFNIYKSDMAHTVLPLVATPEETKQVETMRLLTFAELTASSSKKKKRPSKVLEGQLLFAF